MIHAIVTSLLDASVYCIAPRALSEVNESMLVHVITHAYTSTSELYARANILALLRLVTHVHVHSTSAHGRQRLAGAAATCFCTLCLGGLRLLAFFSFAALQHQRHGCGHAGPELAGAMGRLGGARCGI